jgi:hypothetical protein
MDRLKPDTAGLFRLLRAPWSRESGMSGREVRNNPYIAKIAKIARILEVLAVSEVSEGSENASSVLNLGHLANFGNAYRLPNA